MKHKNINIWKYYEIKGKLLRKYKNCPRCGEGVILSSHKNRYYCGKCKYTEIFK